ncbi:MAG: hypothetical protein WCD18_01385 [Thermosynechococcaceae cyanobacterium]
MSKGRKITFYSPAFKKEDQDVASASITVHVGNGDAVGILEVIAEKGGIWNDDQTLFIPYPCALVEIEDA